ncbi:MAG TPA: phosphodiesterase [Dermatophilaceae bacterium]|nr:phosphodiesterase [Dermatophilaceae bacterium]
MTVLAHVVRRGAGSVAGGAGSVAGEAGTLAAKAGGAVLAGVFGSMAVARGDKPLHALGRVAPGRLTVSGRRVTGVPLLDRPGTTEVWCRLSRALTVATHGLDVMGIAVRIPGAGPGGEDADVLFASTGTGDLSRYLFRPRGSTLTGPLTTLLPGGRSGGPRLLGLFPDGPYRYRLVWSGVRGAWTQVGTLEIDVEGPALDEPVRFDPVGRPLRGLEPPVWVRRLRSPAYAAARTVSRPHAVTDPRRVPPLDALGGAEALRR